MKRREKGGGGQTMWRSLRVWNQERSSGFWDLPTDEGSHQRSWHKHKVALSNHQTNVINTAEKQWLHNVEGTPGPVMNGEMGFFPLLFFSLSPFWSFSFPSLFSCNNEHTERPAAENFFRTELTP